MSLESRMGVEKAFYEVTRGPTKQQGLKSQSKLHARWSSERARREGEEAGSDAQTRRLTRSESTTSQYRGPQLRPYCLPKEVMFNTATQ